MYPIRDASSTVPNGNAAPTGCPFRYSAPWPVVLSVKATWFHTPAVQIGVGVEAEAAVVPSALKSVTAPVPAESATESETRVAAAPAGFDASLKSHTRDTACTVEGFTMATIVNGPVMPVGPKVAQSPVEANWSAFATGSYVTVLVSVASHRSPGEYPTSRRVPVESESGAETSPCGTRVGRDEYKGCCKIEVL